MCVYGAQNAGRMLNLITGQVSHRAPSDSIPMPQDYCPWQKSIENENDYFVQQGSPEHDAWVQYVSELHSNTAKRQNLLSTASAKTPLLHDLQQTMPDFTPSKADNIVYVNVSAAQASSVNDVSAYLLQLKQDLHIGESGYPDQCVVCGDQQTYSIVKNLKLKFSNTFSWVLPMPGDWHLLKLCSETLRDMLWDGGLHELAVACGHKKEIHQWRDIHNVLCALHESLLSESLCGFKQEQNFHSYDQ